MSDFLIGLYEKRHSGQGSREGLGAFAGLTGLCCNALLFAAKLAVGLLSGSMAIVADAVNNLSDAGASVVTLLGFRIAQKPADAKHPYGHARVEYMSGAGVALAILLIGVELLKSSIQKIASPSPVSFSAWTFVTLAAALAVKGWMSAFYRRVAARINSSALAASADDSRNDMITTAAVLLSALAQYLWGFEIDGWAGAAVAAFILVSGVGVLWRSMSPLLGEAPSRELMEALEGLILSHDGVLGLHDLMVHSYGPSRLFATAHVEMSASLDPLRAHGVLDHIERDALKDLGVKLVIHLDPVAQDDAELDALRPELESALKGVDGGLEMHDLRVAHTHDHTNLIFDVVVPQDLKKTDAELERSINAAVSAIDASYCAVVDFDRNYQATL